MIEATSLGLVVFLLVFSAFFSSSEAAFLSVRKTRIAYLVSSGVPGAQRVAKMIEEPERLLSTILLGNNLVNVAFTSVITVTIVDYMGQGREGSAVLVATAVGTVVLLLLGEVIPKTVAVRKSERVAFLYAPALKATELLLFPFVMALRWTTRGVNRVVGTSGAQHTITEGELRTLIDIGEAEGTFEPSEAEMLENVFQFGDRQVREVMTPRVEIVSLQVGGTLREFLDTYARNTHTRFPVYRESADNIIGIISAKDVLNKLATGGLAYDDSVTDVIRDSFFVPETKRVSELFDEMRHTGNQMAIMIDEFGGLAGLVTLKRLLEVVVGPVGEEGEAPEDEYRTIDENTFQVEGGMSIQEVNQELDVELPSGNFETIAGFVLNTLGHFPEEHEQFDHASLKFEIIRMDKFKIEEIKITKTGNHGGDAPIETDPDQARRD